jgi:hypothetical protein
VELMPIAQAFRRPSARDAISPRLATIVNLQPIGNRPSLVPSAAGQFSACQCHFQQNCVALFDVFALFHGLSFWIEIAARVLVP